MFVGLGGELDFFLASFPSVVRFGGEVLEEGGGGGRLDNAWERLPSNSEEDIEEMSMEMSNESLSKDNEDSARDRGCERISGGDFALSEVFLWCGGGGERVIFLLFELDVLRMLISDSDSLLESRTKSTSSSKRAGGSAFCTFFAGFSLSFDFSFFF